ncbi:uncharacterized protein OCT59_025516 [Rhizophagus irregularis]|uniref:Uncharacterized protein n=2 Tax=Rhizophagus irregularis TaxID=588596 RepID=A0A015KZM7_RHIIW|nr:glycosyltransferase family 1 protein [Rhizophagus irregularis DAOM 181602=DAOM 197198]EXX73029.1 hypothetical protein RirG_063930 [Rhizophagus irregularis DAOM 197198w]UZO05156.1 hypothetical protein OCT59_025516 [Rhizophagus irregularis]POG71968.1 glycosyltransferase family 1 protein [Rhizophagus irregularis DAOM 181602=DAOM 197198]CAG8614809.1 17818_t:CDS:2 [Rhizophagus irregularis]GBC11377.1 glycosyltransferase family 1 protein [Rhizophagus irregularis DAOM 181602=DAOM 197198]|eukprot:XP_025178834.1 glycosyltransferase family 1 protein [Rhizophagus irregularis DAOM 181602=DAOM 197198]
MKYHSLTKRLFSKKFLHFIILCNLFFNVVIGADPIPSAAPPISGWIPREMNLDRTEIPKNILVVVPVGGLSHLRHILTISNILADRGYNVTLTTKGTFKLSQQYPKINFISLGEVTDFLNNPEFVDLVQGKFNIGKLQNIFKKRFDSYNSTFLQLKVISEIVKPDLFFCDTLNNEPCFDMAWVKNKPFVGIATSVLGLSRVPYKSDPLFECKVSMENESFWERFRCEIISPLKFIWTLRNSFGEFNEVRASYGLPTLKNPFDRWQSSLFLLDNFFGFEMPIPLSPIIQEIGPVLPDYYPPLTPDIEKFLTLHKRTMFVALGSFLFLTPENNAKLLQSIIEATENGIVDGVIWANIVKNRESFPPSITLSNGRIISTSDIFENKNPNIHMASFAPQFAILNHTNTKLFLSHSGAGSAHESLYTGTPILALPITFDQPGNAEKLELAGVALTLDKLNLDVNDILDKIKRIQNDEQIQSSLRRIKTLAIINSNRKYRAADLIEFTLHSSALNQKNINDDNKFDDKLIFKDLITPDTRMGFIKGKYLDVYATALVIFVSILYGILRGLYIIGKLIYVKLFKNEDKEKKE